MPSFPGPRPKTRRRTVGEIDGFINLLRAACEDQTVNAALERLLSYPDEKRREFVHGWVRDLLVREAPQDFTEAIACLVDDAIAEKAYEVIFQCRR